MECGNTPPALTRNMEIPMRQATATIQKPLMCKHQFADNGTRNLLSVIPDTPPTELLDRASCLLDSALGSLEHTTYEIDTSKHEGMDSRLIQTLWALTSVFEQAKAMLDAANSDIQFGRRAA